MGKSGTPGPKKGTSQGIAPKQAPKTTTTVNQVQPPPSKTQLVTPKTTPDKRVAESSTTADQPSGAGVKAPQKLDLTGTQVTPKKIIKDVNDGVPHGFCKLTETRLRDKLIAAESIIKSATDITSHDVKWKDKLAKEWT